MVPLIFSVCKQNSELIFSKQVGLSVTLWICVREMLGSNYAPVTGYPE
jgi:hypothetical protein